MTARLSTVIGEGCGLKQGVYLVGIDGPGGAGKSSLARLLARDLEASLVEGDDFYRDLDEVERWNLTPEEGASRYFDWERLRKEVLSPGAKGDVVTYNPFDWERRRGLSDFTITIEPAPVLIVEGVYTCRPELIDLFDFRILVDTETETRLARMHARGHGNERWIPKWEAAQNYYFESIFDWNRIDHVVSGDQGAWQ